ncbi:MAG: ribonuclease III [Mycoplasma sp.]
MNQKYWTNKLIEILSNYKIHRPKSIAIYQEALTHKSFANENGIQKNQQRLEFLGDAAIGWVISNYLFSIRPTVTEGQMTIIKASLVNTDTLAMAAKEIGIVELILKGKGLVQMSPKVLEDSFEAFIGAIAQDQGIKKVINILNLTLIKYYENKLINLEKDYKTKFQEEMQSIHGVSTNSIEYISEPVGKQYESKLYYAEMLYGVGLGETKKKAEQLAAKNALEKRIQ